MLIKTLEQRNSIGSLWQGVQMYIKRPILLEYYLNALEVIKLAHK